MTYLSSALKAFYKSCQCK